MATAVIESGNVPLIYSKIVEIRKQVGAIRKDSTGGVPYSFRGVDQVINAIYPALNEHNIIIYPISANRVLTQRLVGGREQNGVLVGQKLMSTSDIKLGLRIVAAEDGSHIDVEVAGESQDYSDKSTAQAHSVAYRIAVLQTFTLPTDAPDPELNQVQAGGIEESTPAAKREPTAADLVAKLTSYVKAKEVVNPAGELVPIEGPHINAIAERLFGSEDSFKANKSAWKTSLDSVQKVIAEVEAGKRA